MAYEAATAGSRTITAFFDSRTDAEEAVDRLVGAGLARGDIQLVAGQEGGTRTGSSTTGTYGRDEGGFWDALKDLFMPDEDRYTYAEGLRRGGYLVTARPNAASYETALDILDDEGTIDISERETAWKSEGWSGYTGATSTGGLSGGGALRSSTNTGYSDRGDVGRGVTAGSDIEDEGVISVAEEQLRVGKRDVSHGRVRVRSYVVETPVSEQVTLREENVHVERRPVDRALNAGDRLFQDRTIEVEERSEEAVVAKEARVREEVVVKKDVGQRTETVSDTVRHTEVEVEDERGTRVVGDRNTTR